MYISLYMYVFRCSVQGEVFTMCVSVSPDHK